MIVPINQIIEKFENLQNDKETREAIADFASRAMKADDEQNLTMEPKKLSPIIWQAIDYLGGVDFRVSPNSYLHSKQNFLDFRKKLGI